jgi:hypothetical protein
VVGLKKHSGYLTLCSSFNIFLCPNGQGIRSTALRAFQRGGNWNNGTNSGAFTLNLNNVPTNTNTNIGFRCARYSLECLCARSERSVYGHKPVSKRIRIFFLPE